MLPAIIDDPQVQLIPVFTRKHLFQIRFRLLNATPACQLPTLREPMDVSVDRKCRLMKHLRHHDACGLVAHSRQLLEFSKRPRHLSAMLFDQHAR